MIEPIQNLVWNSLPPSRQNRDRLNKIAVVSLSALSVLTGSTAVVGAVFNAKVIAGQSVLLLIFLSSYLAKPSAELQKASVPNKEESTENLSPRFKPDNPPAQTLSRLADAMADGLSEYAGTLPRIKGVKIQSNDKQCMTQFSYSIFESIIPCTLLLDRVNIKPIRGQKLVQAPLVSSDIESNSLMRTARKVFSVVATPFSFIVSYFNRMIENERVKQHAFLDKVISHYELPSSITYSSNRLFESEIETFKLKWPYKTPELAAKEALVRGFYRLNREQFDSAIPQFQLAILLAESARLRAIASAALIALYQHLIDKTFNKHLIPAYEKKIQSYNTFLKTIENSPEVIALRQDLRLSLRFFINECETCLSPDCTDEQIKELNQLDVNTFGVFPGVRSVLAEAFFPEVNAFRYNVLAHLCLVNQMVPNSDRLDIESRFILARSHLQTALQYAEKMEGDEKNQVIASLNRNIEEVKKISDTHQQARNDQEYMNSILHSNLRNRIVPISRLGAKREEEESIEKEGA